MWRLCEYFAFRMYRDQPCSGKAAMMHDEVVSRLRRLLIEGEIPPGARIPERELCASLSVSRPPLREALKVLAAEGLVVLLPNRGSRAAKLTQKDVKELFEVCEALEATAGELACPRITDQQLREIAALQATMVEHYRARDLLAYYRCNRLIHEAIVRAADNAVLAGFYESIAARIRRARFITPMSPEHFALAVSGHEGILNPLPRRDGSGLANILRTHLRRKRDEVALRGVCAAPSCDKSLLG